MAIISFDASDEHHVLTSTLFDTVRSTRVGKSLNVRASEQEPPHTIQPTPEPQAQEQILEPSLTVLVVPYGQNQSEVMP